DRRDGRRDRSRALPRARRPAYRPGRRTRPGPRAGAPVRFRLRRPVDHHQGRRLRGSRSLRDAGRAIPRTGRRRLTMPGLPVLGVTMGDPAGVGPEIIARAAAEPQVVATSRPVVIGSADVMKAALALIGSPLASHVVRDVEECRWANGTLEVLDLANVDAATLPRAQVSAAAGRAAYEAI